MDSSIVNLDEDLKDKPPNSTLRWMTWPGLLDYRGVVAKRSVYCNRNQEVQNMQENTMFENGLRSSNHQLRLRFGLGIAVSVLSGVMLLLSFPPYGVWPLAWIAFAPYIFAQYRLLPSKWSSLAPGLALLVWLGPFMARLFGTEFGPFFTFLGVLIAFLSFLPSKERSFHETTGYRWFIPQGVINWVGFEMIRATIIPLVATSAFIGYTQATQPWLTQPVSIFSLYGLNLLIMLVNFALAQVAMLWFDRRWQPEDVVPLLGRSTGRWLAAVAGLLVIWIALGFTLLRTAAVDSPTVRVAALQPKYDKPSFQDEIVTDEMRFEDFSAWTRQAAEMGAEIIFTPEMAFDVDPQVQLTDDFKALASETGTYLFITYTVTEEGQPFRNESVLLLSLIHI